MLLIICCWGVHTGHKAVHHGLVSTNGLSIQSIYCLGLKVTGKEMELCQFSMKSKERPEYFEWLFFPLHTFEIWVLFVFLLWENFCSLLQGCLLWHLCQGSEPEQTRQVCSLYYSVRDFRSARRKQAALGLENDFALRHDRHRSRSLMGMLPRVGVPQLPPRPAALCSCWVCARAPYQKVALQTLLEVESPQHTPKLRLCWYRHICACWGLKAL